MAAERVHRSLSLPGTDAGDDIAAGSSPSKVSMGLIGNPGSLADQSPASKAAGQPNLPMLRANGETPEHSPRGADEPHVPETPPFIPPQSLAVGVATRNMKMLPLELATLAAAAAANDEDGIPSSKRQKVQGQEILSEEQPDVSLLLPNLDFGKLAARRRAAGLDSASDAVDAAPAPV